MVVVDSSMRDGESAMVQESISQKDKMDCSVR